MEIPFRCCGPFDLVVTSVFCLLPTFNAMIRYQAGMGGEAIFFTGRGGAGKGLAKNLWGGEPPPLPTVWGGAGKTPPYP